jgi:hypothetical protein
MVRIPAGITKFLFSKMSITALGPIQPPIQWVRGSFPGIKWLEHAADHSPPSSAEVTMEWSYTTAPPICLHSMDRGNSTFTQERLLNEWLQFKNVYF